MKLQFIWQKTKEESGSGSSSGSVEIKIRIWIRQKCHGSAIMANRAGVLFVQKATLELPHDGGCERISSL